MMMMFCASIIMVVVVFDETRLFGLPFLHEESRAFVVVFGHDDDAREEEEEEGATPLPLCSLSRLSPGRFFMRF